MRAVLDTNVLVSALIRGRKPRRLLSVLLRPSHALILTEEIVEEFSRVTSDDKIRRYADDETISAFLEVLLSRAVFVKPTPKVRVLNDAHDAILSAAKGGDADFVVTGDKHILELKKLDGIKIVTVARALSLVGRKG